MNIVFMGTPKFAVPCLEALFNKGYEISTVITQPDKPKGRGKKIVEPEVKTVAKKMGIAVHQPSRISEPDFLNRLKDLNPDLIVVVAFGQILTKEILDLPNYGCINVHASLLPKLRGAAPINWSIINGDKITGITIMYMDSGLDTGDIILQESINIGEEETAGELHDRLAILGSKALIEAVESIENDEVARTKQNHDEASYAPMLTKEMGRIDWSMDAVKIKNLIRGTYPWPGAYSFYDGNMFKIFSVETVHDNVSNDDWGMIYEVEKEYFTVKCKKGFLRIIELQFQNKKKMSVESYLKGHEILIGKILS